MSGSVKKLTNTVKGGIVGSSLGASIGFAKDLLTPEEAKAMEVGDLGLAEAKRLTKIRQQKAEFKAKRQAFAETLKQLQWAGPSGT